MDKNNHLFLEGDLHHHTTEGLTGPGPDLALILLVSPSCK